MIEGRLEVGGFVSDDEDSDRGDPNCGDFDISRAQCTSFFGVAAMPNNFETVSVNQEFISRILKLHAKMALLKEACHSRPQMQGRGLEARLFEPDATRSRVLSAQLCLAARSVTNLLIRV